MRDKAKRYRRADIKEVVMITSGSKERLSVFLETLPFPKRAGAQMDNIHALLKKDIKKDPGILPGCFLIVFLLVVV